MPSDEWPLNCAFSFVAAVLSGATRFGSD